MSIGAGNASIPIWTCSMWGLPGMLFTEHPVCSYHTISPLPRKKILTNPCHLSRRYIFCCTFGTHRSLWVPRVTGHITLWSSDFPPAQKYWASDRSTCLPNSKGSLENSSRNNSLYQLLQKTNSGANLQNSFFFIKIQPSFYSYIFWQINRDSRNLFYLANCLYLMYHYKQNKLESY